MSDSRKLIEPLTDEAVASELAEILAKLQDDSHPQRVSIKLLPHVRDHFKSQADAMGISFVELVRRALFAAALDPSTLTSEPVEEFELKYKQSMTSTKWTKSALDALELDEPS